RHIFFRYNQTNSSLLSVPGSKLVTNDWVGGKSHISDLDLHQSQSFLIFIDEDAINNTTLSDTDSDIINLDAS
ncbi:hypothetical protein PpSQ1_27240, partial [Pseudomonas putida]